MRPLKHFGLSFILLLFLVACTKENPTENNLIESASNSEEPVKPGQPNCAEAITSNIRLNLVVDSSKLTSTSTSVKFFSKTEKLYPSGGYILVFDLTRTGSNIKLEYKQVHTACGNPAAAALLPATSSPAINNLTVGSYPIEIIVNSSINKGVLNIPASPGSPTLVMQTTNGIIIE